LKDVVRDEAILVLKGTVQSLFIERNEQEKVVIGLDESLVPDCFAKPKSEERRDILSLELAPEKSMRRTLRCRL